MYLLYTDESGSEDSTHFVVGGVAVHEDDTAVVSAAIEDLFASLPPPAATAELHSQHIRAGKGPWRRIPASERERLTGTVTSLVTDGTWGRGRALKLFAVVIHKESFPHVDPYERAYEEFFARGNAMVGRLSFAGEPHRCLAIADKSRLESTLQQLMTGWRTQGGSLVGQIRPMVGFAEVPVFVESRASRLIQLADFVAHWVFRAYESGDADNLAKLLPAFDSDGKVLFGLVHLVKRYWECDCIACRSRR
ncbi:MAG: DUF3800 domain-containing protein [Dehalococcoidia bacterium]|nr:DUF3800 domain-containing protein [Dehalococcoidia bacterium]